MAKDPVKAAVARALKQRVARDLKRGVLLGLRTALREMQEMTEDLKADVQQTEASYRRAMFQRLGELAQAAVVDTYERQVVGREGPASAEHYRQGGYRQRLAGGIMHDALSSPKFFQVSNNGLRFGDNEWLSQAAAQWHRLNFGAGGKAGSGVGAFTVDLGEGGGAVLGLPDGPSPAFAMPPGLFRNPGSGRVVGRDPGRVGMDMFEPGRRSAAVGASTTRAALSRRYSQGWIPTQGIEGKHFLEAGLEELAKQIPAAYREYALTLVSGSIRRIATKRRRSRVGVRVDTNGMRLHLP